MNIYTLHMDSSLSYSQSSILKDDIEIARIQFDPKESLSGNLFLGSRVIQISATDPEKVNLLIRYLRWIFRTERSGNPIIFIENNKVIAQLIPNPHLTHHKIIYSENEYFYKNGLVSFKYKDADGNSVFVLKENMIRNGSALEVEETIDDLLTCIFTYGYMAVAKDNIAHISD